MLDRPDVKPIALDRVSRLPWVAPPAGYIILIQDVAYGSRYKIARHQQLDRHLMRRGADFPFETRVARIWQADDAAAAERELHDEIAAGTTFGEWFDLYQFPTAASAPASQYESVSLRDLAQHSGDAESLLQDAKIVGAGRPASTPQAAGVPASAPQTPATGVQRAAPTRRPRRVRWAFALGLFILAGFLVAERSSDIRRAFDSVLDPASRPAISNRAAAPTTVSGRAGTRSALPTPRVEGRAEVFYTKTRANVRACANLSCKLIDVLSPGAKITAQRYAEGQRVNGSDRWIVFRFRGQDANIHSSVVSRVRRISEPSPEPSPTAKPTRVKSTAEGHNEEFYVAAHIQARSCARMSCAAAGLLPLGAKITALKYTKGQSINGSDRWIRFYHDGKPVYLHSSRLTRNRPGSSASPTAQSLDRQGADTVSGEIYYLKTRARARLCTRLDCDVADVFEKGAKIVAAGYLRGERINSNGRWIAFRHNGRDLYLHSDLLTKQRPPVEATAPPKRDGPSAADSGQLYVVLKKIWAHSCASHRCETVQTLNAGDRIKVLDTGAPEASHRGFGWAAFASGDQILYVHRSLLKEAPPESDPTAAPSPAARAAEDAKGEVYYVKSGLRAKVRNCASHDCFEAGKLSPGMRVEANRIVRGQTISGNNEWIMFSFDGWNRFVHSGDLSPLKPRFVPTAAATDMPAATEPPPTATEPLPTATSTATVPPAAKYVVETAGNVNANIRSCPRTSCEIVAKFGPGTEVEVIGSVTGETVYDTDVWLEIWLESGSAFIHSALVAEAE